MKIYNKEEAREKLIADIRADDSWDQYEDNQGMICIYTGLFQWEDGAFRERLEHPDNPEDWDDEEAFGKNE